MRTDFLEINYNVRVPRVSCHLTTTIITTVITQSSFRVIDLTGSPRVPDRGTRITGFSLQLSNICCDISLNLLCKHRGQTHLKKSNTQGNDDRTLHEILSCFAFKFENSFTFLGWKVPKSLSQISLNKINGRRGPPPPHLFCRTF